MILLSIVTLGIYLLYWIYITFAEVKARRGKGTSGIVGLLLALIPVSIFLLPSYVGDMYAEEGKDEADLGHDRAVGARPARRRHHLAVQGAGQVERLLEHGERRSEPAAMEPPAAPAEAARGA